MPPILLGRARRPTLHTDSTMSNTMDHESEEYLLASGAAELLGGVTPKTVSRWAKEGRLP
jgi:hypothetical protein